MLPEVVLEVLEQQALLVLLEQLVLLELERLPAVQEVLELQVLLVM